MNRLITVKGIGKLSVKPDLIIITMNVESHQHDYDKTMAQAAESIKILQQAIQSAGFAKEDLKTTSLNIRTHYEGYHDKNNNYKRRFAGYRCEQGLKLEFDFSTELMAKVLNAIAPARIEPQLEIQFSVKNKSAVNEALLIDAAENALQKAEILTSVSGVKLGELINIDYNWSELHLYSPTNYLMEKSCMETAGSYAPDIEPDDIDVSDTVTFVWEIKSGE